MTNPSTPRAASCAAALLLLAPSVQADFIVDAVVDADAYVGHGGDNNVNYGAASTLDITRWINNFLGNSDKAWIRFDLNGATPGTITDAVFSLTLADETARFGVFDFEVYGLNEGVAGEAPAGSGGWDEATITGSNAPGNVVTSTFEVDAAETTLLGTFTKPVFNNQAGQSVGITAGAGSDLVNFLNADTNGVVTLIVVRTTEDNRPNLFASKENGTVDGPSLTLTVPEPGSMGLAALAGAVLLQRVRSK
ncbi:MAG: DNRLRE domain-containing protein [Planctomycetota bacterium]